MDCAPVSFPFSILDFWSWTEYILYYEMATSLWGKECYGLDVKWLIPTSSFISILCLQPVALLGKLLGPLGGRPPWRKKVAVGGLYGLQPGPVLAGILSACSLALGCNQAAPGSWTITAIMNTALPLWPQNCELKESTKLNKVAPLPRSAMPRILSLWPEQSSPFFHPINYREKSSYHQSCSLKVSLSHSLG